MATSAFKVSSTVRTIPRTVGGLPFEPMKNAVLGKSYQFSLVFIGDTLSRRLNNTYRGKDKPTNILSFPVSKDSGEIFINLKLADRQKKKFNKNLTDFVAYLFIHGLFHLKGMGHGSRMEEREFEILTKFKFNNESSNSSRD